MLTATPEYGLKTDTYLRRHEQYVVAVINRFVHCIISQISSDIAKFLYLTFYASGKADLDGILPRCMLMESKNYGVRRWKKDTDRSQEYDRRTEISLCIACTLARCACVASCDKLFFRFITIHAFDWRTDRQTDRRTDRILIARPRLHSMQRGKNGFLGFV